MSGLYQPLCFSWETDRYRPLPLSHQRHIFRATRLSMRYTCQAMNIETTIGADRKRRYRERQRRNAMVVRVEIDADAVLPAG